MLITRARLIGLRCLFTATLALAAGPLTAAELVKIAIIGGTGDVGFYVADAKGYFRDEGIEVEMIPFDSGARMIAPLSTGDIDVGAGAVSAGLYNAFEREITMRVVADKGRNTLAYSLQGLLVRKALVESGEVKSIKDLKGRKIGFTAPGANDSAVMDEALRKEGLSFADIDPVFMGLPQHMAAYASGAIAASIVPEPFLTAAQKNGSAVQLMSVAQMRNNAQLAAVVYSDLFARKRPDVARKLMKAYIRGIRTYQDGLENGHIAANAKGEEIIAILAKYSSMKDPALLRVLVPAAFDPDGWPNVESLRTDWAFYKAQGLIKGTISVDQVLDKSYVDWAVKELGPYKPH